MYDITQNFQNPLDENFSYGYDGNLYNLRSSNKSEFQCYYKQAKYIPISFKEECIKVCEKISDYAESVGRIPMVLLSGGLDSEVVVRSFIESGRPFQIVSNRFNNQLNDHEIQYVKKFSIKHNLKIEYIDLDITSLLTSDRYLKMAEISRCPYAEMLPTMDLIDRVYFEMNGVPVLGNGDFYASKIDNAWTYIEFEYILAWMRYVIDKKIAAAINFFQYTPEIVLSMALDPIVHDAIIGDQYPNVRQAKYAVYRKYWNDIELRTKYNGAESIQSLCDEINEKYLAENKIYTSKWSNPLYQFLKNMMPRENEIN